MVPPMYASWLKSRHRTFPERSRERLWDKGRDQSAGRAASNSVPSGISTRVPAPGNFNQQSSWKQPGHASSCLQTENGMLTVRNMKDKDLGHKYLSSERNSLSKYP